MTLAPEIWREAPADLQDAPTAEMRTALVIVAGFLAAVISWGMVAPLDAAATAEGTITVDGHDDAIAHREGGVLSELDVVEGQHVRAGQVVAKLAPEALGADVAVLKAQVISLQAQHARLAAELDGSARITWPNEFLALSGDDMGAADSAMRIQQAQFDADAADPRAQAGAAGARSAGLAAQVAGAQGQLASNARQQSLLGEQLRGVSSLADQGYAPVNSVRALQRSAAELAGARDQIVAQIGQNRQQIAESQLAFQSTRRQRSEQTATTLRDTEDQLLAALPKLAAAQAQLERGTLRARVDGHVAGLSVFSRGSVVAAGQTIMEIVPDNPRLVVQAKVPANRAGGLKVGQKAEVRMSSQEARTNGLLAGAVTQLSADSFADDHTGQHYFTLSVTVPSSEIRKAEGRGDVLRLSPGLPAEVMIPLRKRNAFEYLFEPLTQSLWKSFRQP